MGSPAGASISVDIAAIKTEIDHGTYGLSALETLVDEVETLLKDGTYGLSALETLIDEVESLLKDATYGLSALKTEIDANETKIDTVDSNVDTLITRVPAEVTQRAKSLYAVREKFFADSTRITVTATAGNQTIKTNFSISLIPTNVTIDYVHVYVFAQIVENTNAAANKVDAAQYIQIQKNSGGSWTNCVAILDDALRVPASTRDMGRLIGVPIDCKAEVDSNTAYDLQWTDADMDQASMNFDDVFFIVEIGFH